MSNATFWKGVLPAITTPFNADGSVDHAFLARHANQLVDAGCSAIVPLGSLGEAQTLSFDEKVAIITTLVEAVGGRVPIVPGIAALASAEAARLAQAARAAGARGLMVLPVYAYTSDWHEAKAHASAVLGATELPCILYNNPVAYRTDILPAQIAELAAEFPNLQAVKESSGEVRRFAAIKALLGDRLVLLVGMDDAIVEGVSMGAEGWVAGLVNALPAESVQLFKLARDGGYKAAAELYNWFLPLLRLDTVPKFVQLIKLVQARVGMGSETVRAPRLPIAGAERAAALQVIDHAIASKPQR